MLRNVSFVILFTILFTQVAFGQEVDWDALFAGAQSGDQAVQEQTRAKIIDEIIPKLVSEDASLVLPEIPILADQLSRVEVRRRLQASGVFGVLSTTRPDSETVLAAAFPALKKHFQDTDANTRENCVLALAGLMPSIPEDVLGSLTNVLQAKRSDLTLPAMRGVARLYGSNPIASNAIDDYLNGDDEKKLTVLESLKIGIQPNAALISRLGRLLSDQNLKIVDATLEAIGNT
ncbi:MAG: hypothetical protein M3Y72_10045, partial [Acidobacteriota bacterium]|nr:hypothetical protein [Acidobacteriota bacterium]